MSDELINNTDETDLEYQIVVKRQTDIINDITFDEKERIIYESIITGIEQNASNAVRNNKIAQLPSIGCIRKNPVRQAIKDNYENFRLARTHLNKEEYQNHVRSIMHDAKLKQVKLDAYKLSLKRAMSKNKKKYDLLYTTIGKGYANMFIQSLLLLKEVPYVLEVQEHFDRINKLV